MNRLSRRAAARAAATAESVAQACVAENLTLREANRELRRRLDLCERARASLDEQLRTVQASNESMYREALDQAGMLARRPEGGEPR